MAKMVASAKIDTLGAIGLGCWVLPGAVMAIFGFGHHQTPRGHPERSYAFTVEERSAGVPSPQGEGRAGVSGIPARFDVLRTFRLGCGSFPRKRGTSGPGVIITNLT